jgi:hypothetical protein
MISLEIGETMIELSWAALEASAGDRMGGQVDRRGEGGAVRVASPADGSETHHLGNPQSDVEHGLLSGRVIW